MTVADTANIFTNAKRNRSRVQGHGSYLEFLDGVGHRSREGDVFGDLAASVEGEVEAVGAPHAQLPEVVGLPVELAHELLLAREVVENVGAGQVTANKITFGSPLLSEKNP